MMDIFFMRMAMELAGKGCGFVSPNPMVGAVIVKNGEVIGKGWHRKYGDLHAERNALADCREPPKGAEMYVTLEPCCHYGKTPPCTDAILASGIRRVVIGASDPFPLVAGRGIQILREAGVQVEVGILEDECRRQNRVFFHYIRTGTPYVVMKYAMTMDGKIATFSGKSRWITGPAARENVHRDRLRYSAVMVGVNTVISDNPLLTCRAEGGRNPARIICDTNLRTPICSAVVSTAGDIPTYIATSCGDPERQQPFLAAGCRIIPVPERNGHIDLETLMVRLGKERIDSILLEGGGKLNYSALESGIVRLVQAYIAPKLFGGETAHTPLAGAGVEVPEGAFRLVNTGITMLGEDILIESEVASGVHGNR